MELLSVSISKFSHQFIITLCMLIKFLYKICVARIEVYVVVQLVTN